MNQKLIHRSRLSRRHQTHLNNDIVVHKRKRLRSDLPIIVIGEKYDGPSDEIRPMIEGIQSNVQRSERHTLLEHMFDKIETHNYISHNISVERLYDRPSYLVERAISNVNNLHEKMNENDIMLHLLMAKIITRLSKKNN